jgi:hypothetical protein
MLGVLVFGLGAYALLPVAALPKVDFPTIARRRVPPSRCAAIVYMHTVL